MASKITIVHPVFGESTIIDTSFKVWEEKGWSIKSDSVPAVEEPEPEPTQEPEEVAAEGEENDSEEL